MLEKNKRFLCMLPDVLDFAVFIMLLLNILLWPTLANRTYLFARVVSNVAEYLFMFLALVLAVYKTIISKKIGRQFVILGIMIIYLFLVTLMFGVVNLSTLSLFSKYISSFLILFCVTLFKSNRTKKRIIQFVTIISFIWLVISSIYIIGANIELLKQAFTGGRYRLGNLEYQANGYATYCVLIMIIIIDIFNDFKKKWILAFSLLPLIICFGTQSKKGIILCFVLFTYSFFLLIGGIRQLKGKILFGLYSFLTIAVTIFLLVKTNLLYRLFNFSDLSNFERIQMIIYALRGASTNILFGFGLNSFPGFFDANYGSGVILHSTIFDLLFSGGLIALSLWAYFFYFLASRNYKNNKLFCTIIIITQILLDLTAQIWYMPINFVLIALVFSNLQVAEEKHINSNETEFYDIFI